MFAVVGQNFPFSDYVNGFRVLDRMKKHKFVKFELWMSSGVGSHKAGSEEYKQNLKIMEAITSHAHAVLNRTSKISLYDLITKDHFVASKVN